MPKLPLGCVAAPAGKVSAHISLQSVLEVSQDCSFWHMGEGGGCLLLSTRAKCSTAQQQKLLDRLWNFEEESVGALFQTR